MSNVIRPRNWLVNKLMRLLKDKMDLRSEFIELRDKLYNVNDRLRRLDTDIADTKRKMQELDD